MACAFYPKHIPSGIWDIAHNDEGDQRNVWLCLGPERGNTLVEIASAFKVACHPEKLMAYLRGERIFPATLELDITSACNKDCRDCPSARGRRSHELSIHSVRHLFSVLEGQTRGLLLTGGEPTLSPFFPEVLRMARDFGFLDLAVVTNGSFLDDRSVANALLAHASTVRVSLYGWGDGSCAGLYPTLGQIELLRSQIESEGSDLRIGVSALTSAERVDSLETVLQDTASAGAHWLYFHPTCTRWHIGAPTQVDQSGVLKRVRGLQNSRNGEFRVFISSDRYAQRSLTFHGYHGAHFLLVVGADGKNYLAPEVKYQPQHVVADLSCGFDEDFLWEPDRLQRLNAVASATYPAIGSRHRGELYSDFIEGLVVWTQTHPGEDLPIPQQSFAFPHIL